MTLAPGGRLSTHSLPGPQDITRVELANGLVVLARPNFNSPSVVINGYLTAGSLFDPDKRLGLADFTAEGLMRGTQRYAFQDLYDRLESVGAGFGFNAHTHTLGFSGRSLAEDLDLLLDLMSQTLRQPTFPDDQIERLRAQLMTGLALRAQNTAEMASLAFDQLVYDGHPYSRPEDGYPEMVKAITRDELAAFHREIYGPAGMVIAIVGAVEPERAVAQVNQTLGDWRNDGQPQPPALPPWTGPEGDRRKKVDIPGKIQADLVLGTAGPPRSAPDFLSASLGNSVLGQFGLYGRIGDAVRERAGLAYYAYSSLSGGVGPGPWTVAAGVDPAVVDQAVALIRAEIARFVEEPVTEEELEDSKSNFIGRLPLSLQSNGGVAGALINLERYELGLDYYQRYPEIVSAITPEAVQQAAQAYLDPDQLALAVAGP